MPEIVTRYPDTALSILKNAGISCGTNQPQRILTACPKEQFCALPTGEICVFGTKDINALTQMTPWDFILIPSMILPMSTLFIMIFLLGLLAGIKISKQ